MKVEHRANIRFEHIAEALNDLTSATVWWCTTVQKNESTTVVRLRRLVQREIELELPR